jgi:hypothetical protein
MMQRRDMAGTPVRVVTSHMRLNNVANFSFDRANLGSKQRQPTNQSIDITPPTTEISAVLSKN